MRRENAIEQYKKIYGDILFTRSALFETVMKHFDVETVLYPGSSVHITPALYFPHVVFIDRSEEVMEFFRDMPGLKAFINANKKYKRSSYMRYLDADYTEALPLRDNEYDLLLALFADDVSDSCLRYLKIGGIILSNNHHGDAERLVSDGRVKLKGVIRKKSRKYILNPCSEEDLPGIIERCQPPARYLKRNSNGLEYVDRECYYILEKYRGWTDRR